VNETKLNALIEALKAKHWESHFQDNSLVCVWDDFEVTTFVQKLDETCIVLVFDIDDITQPFDPEEHAQVVFKKDKALVSDLIEKLKIRLSLHERMAA
jgi:hypothetical protein